MVLHLVGIGLRSAPGTITALNNDITADFFQLPPEEHLVEPPGVAINSKGHIYVFHRGKHPLMEFNSSGKFLRSIADELFVTAHMVRVDPEDNIWTTDIGSHVVLKLSPEGRVWLAPGRMRIPGDDVLLFNQPTDVAWDRDGNIYVTDGYGNSRVLKFDKCGRPLLGWGMKGRGPGPISLRFHPAPNESRIDRAENHTSACPLEWRRAFCVRLCHSLRLRECERRRRRT